MMSSLDPTDGAQVRAWAEAFGSTPAERLKVIRDMLAHANADRMDEADRAIARSALELIQREQVA